MDSTSDVFTSKLKLRHLRFIATLAETGSMARTAERLFVSYPAVAKTRLEIEEIVGARLTTGRGEAASFTDAGKCLLAASQRILNELVYVTEQVAALRDGLQGHVVVGVRSLDALRWLAPRITQFRASFPSVSISLVDGLHEGVSCGEVDLGLARAGPLRLPTTLAMENLFAIRSVVVGSGYMQGRQLAPGKINWHILLNEAWVLPPVGTPLRDRFDDHLARQGLPGPTNIIVGSDAMVQKELMRSGSFLGLSSEEVARSLVQEDIARVLEIDVSALDDHIALIWRAQTRLHPAVFRLKEFLLGDALG
ncbi:hypothetical protein CR159_11380 [Pollutimonas subterranea]|uniref:HTH lysR-type domain-containing protein n=1 Tax=Pollutimonas subterranea TaxID=2045210 RepID=A0A2N4U4D0_9BURK|nr:LysR family transcriptional regulator [Pollutimonas subterranea]PLC49878.1 hypothetical protein CR159_11380 [Pollutimonas subterranea]